MHVAGEADLGAGNVLAAGVSLVRNEKFCIYNKTSGKEQQQR
jgi:hypothetical protein